MFPLPRVSRSGWLAASLLLLPLLARAQWPQFRGPDGLGVAADDARPPIVFSPETNVAWRIDLPTGNSSPILSRGRLVLTAYADRQLITLAFDPATGRELWRQAIAPAQVEEVHRSLGSPATPTPVSDGERFYVHFGSAGLLAYDPDGHELWRRPMPLPVTEYGSSSSPVIAGDLVILLLDQDGGSHLLAVNRRTGQEVWRVERPEMRRGFGTPLVWRHHNRTDLVVPGTIWLKGYDPATGAERWRVSGLARITCTSPVVADGLLLTASWTTGGDRAADRITMPSFDEFLAKYDQDHDGRFRFDELPAGPAKERFKHMDGNRDGFVSRDEWESMAAIFERVENQAFAVEPDDRGQLSDAQVRWRFKRGLPYVASPVAYRGRFYLVKNGGMFTCLDPRTGHALYQEERLGAVGDYYASLMAANGHIYVGSVGGVMSVVKAGDSFEVVASNRLGEAIHASPVAVGDTLYIRTAGHLTAYRNR